VTSKANTRPAGDVPRLGLRPKDAAAALGIGTRKLWEITADTTSGIPHIKLGKCVVYPVEALRAWLAARAAAGARP
jgi:hypothetical protein